MKINDPALKNGEFGFCRSCYDHLAGKVATDIVAAMEKQKLLSIRANKFSLSADGEKWFANVGIDLDAVRNSKRKFGATCTDLTEKKEHIGGSLGAALFNQFEKNKWVQRKTGTRIIMITDKGIKELKKLGITISPQN